MIDKNNTVSIITVSYQAINTIEKTIRSVLEQKYREFEYVLIDGESTDGTYECICNYDEKFTQRGIRYFHISEPDAGVYDAMNKGMRYCRNEWVIYMNANDTFCNENVLSNVFKEEYGDAIGCIYGDAWNVKDGQKYYKKAYPMKTITYRGPFSHQALFVRRDILRKYPFDLSYHISADTNQFVQMYINNIVFLKINIPVANYDLTGMSAKNYKTLKNDWNQIFERAGLKNKTRIRRWWRTTIIPILRNNSTLWYIYVNYFQNNLLTRRLFHRNGA